ncbi:2Fe-2S iron-sulfur cluster-binding protein [Bacillus norwichensis]|uniref:(2Fe-2S)-binding protein n=1 Tax=Bacillus norwichensis TaxID=2762217 RepID=A0ABR8VHS9_9BACI|nr:2Fe-2S iron-sulfur cluster-binding protein [Bacillus norwichensis]MBD8004318.1 (2Fe-2S)-binding protein [Bacillus norwichensis]
MPKIHFVNSDKTFDVPDNSNILRMSLRYDGELPNLCGGGICGTCVFKPVEGEEHLDKITRQEQRKLGKEWIEKGYRLGCQTFIKDQDVAVAWDMEVTKQVKKRKPDKLDKKPSKVK